MKVPPANAQEQRAGGPRHAARSRSRDGRCGVLPGPDLPRASPCPGAESRN